MPARVGFVVIAMTAAVSAAPLAGADETDGTVCAYTMTDPRVVNVNGVSMVTATIDPGACTGSAMPAFAQVCLSAPGRAGRCNELAGYTSSQTYLSPYVPGTTYTARGRGCAAVVNPPRSICTTLGPRSVVL